MTATKRPFPKVHQGLPTARPKAGEYVTKEMVETLVSNAVTQHAKDTAEYLAEVLRQHFAVMVQYGCLVPEGLERMRAAQEAELAARAAPDANAAEQHPAPALVQ